MFLPSLENTQEVTLTKSANSLGFSFLMCELDPPTRDFSSMVRIKQLFPGQPAERSGRIQEGDVLLAVNGQPLKGLSYPVCALFHISAICCPTRALGRDITNRVQQLERFASAVEVWRGSVPPQPRVWSYLRI